MGSRIIIVPDVHGRTFWRKLIAENNFDKVIFLGDYGDPYGYEGITHEDALSELRDIITFKKNNPDKVVLLLGNHDLHYIDDKFACSRYSYQNRHRYKELIYGNIDLFQVAYEYEQNDQKYLFTHAGVTKGWFDILCLHKPYSENAAKYINDVSQAEQILLGFISYWRGGRHQYGSCMWADLREHDGVGAFPNYIQIFGHSQQENDPVINGNMWCLDCRRIFILENNELKEYV